jgi:hypothetical protein
MVFQTLADILRGRFHYDHFPINELSIGRHSPLALAEKVEEWSRRREPNLDPRQRSALGNYRRAEIFSTRNMKNHKEIDILEAYSNSWTICSLVAPYPRTVS